MGSFGSQVKAWTKKAKRKRKLIMGRSLDLLTKDMLKNTIVVSGNLRRSLMASTVMMPTFKKDVKFDAENTGLIALTIAGMSEGDPFYFGFQAAYAARWNYGFTGTDSLGRKYTNNSGSGMVQRSAAKWVAFVKQAERELGE